MAALHGNLISSLIIVLVFATFGGYALAVPVLYPTSSQALYVEVTSPVIMPGNAAWGLYSTDQRHIHLKRGEEKTPPRSGRPAGKKVTFQDEPSIIGPKAPDNAVLKQVAETADAHWDLVEQATKADQKKMLGTLYKYYAGHAAVTQEAVATLEKFGLSPRMAL